MYTRSIHNDVHRRTDAVAAAAESARKRGRPVDHGNAVGSAKIAAEFGNVYSAIVGSATEGEACVDKAVEKNQL